MKQDQIIKKIEEGLNIKSELQDLEFKTATTSAPKDIWKSISAFANNKDGGFIILGIDEKDDFKIRGCNDIQKIQTQIVECCSDKMNYIVRPDIQILDYKGHKLISVYIPQCKKEDMPCYYKQPGPFNGSYVRMGNTSRKMTEEEVKTYLASSKEFIYDNTEAPNTNINDLDINKVQSFLEKSSKKTNRNFSSLIDNELLRNLGIVGKFDMEYKPTVAGILIFAKLFPIIHPYNRFTVRCVKYAGDDPSTDVLDELDIIDTLDNHIDKAMDFINKNISHGFDIVGSKRVKRDEYPMKAIRELVANAVIHRDYKITSTFTQIRVFKNRIEISNPGSLPPGVTVENIKDSQVSRNQTIASILKDLDYLEEYGRGIDLVYQELEDYNLPSPIFKNEVNSFEAVILGKKFSGINERQLKIINLLLLKGKINRENCLSILKETPSSTVSTDIKKLKDMGIILQKGHSVSSYYILGI